MKGRLKSLVLAALGAILSFTTVTFTACNDDPCKAIACAYGGVCKDGACACPSGYEGIHCEIVTRDKYVGTWTVFEKGTSTMPAEYPLSIDYGLTPTTLNIRNFYNRFNDKNQPVAATVRGDSMFINTFVEHFKVEGTGVLKWESYYPKHGELTLRYTVRDTITGQINDFGVNAGVPSIWNR